MENKCFVLQEKGVFTYKICEIPKLTNEDDVLIKVSKVGICGSDVHYWKHGRIGDFVVTNPIILGHETAGIIEQCGKNVKHLKPGDRVAIEPGIPCFKCNYCLTGRYNLCEDVIFHATPPYDGTLCKYVTHLGSFCYKLPDKVSNEEGSLLEPLSVAVHACNRAGVSMGQIVLITGAGPIGLVNILVAKARGVSKVIVTDISESRLKKAHSIGADYIYQINPQLSCQEQASQINTLIGDQKPDIALECSGAQPAIELCLEVLKKGGILQCIGMGSLTTNMPLIKAICKEIDIKTCLRYANCYPTALSLVANNQVNVKPLITHRYDFDHALEAFEMTHSGNAVKVIIDVCGDKLK